MVLRGLIQLANLFQNIIAKPTFLYAGTEGGHCHGAYVVLSGSFTSPVK